MPSSDLKLNSSQSVEPKPSGFRPHEMSASMFSETTSLPISAAFTYPVPKKWHGDVRQAPPSTKKPGAKPSPEPAKRSELPRASIQSGGQSTGVLEGTTAESPDMNTIPDAAGGSVSSF
jgi:hypothetical protein